MLDLLPSSEPRFRRRSLQRDYDLLDVPVVEVTYRDYRKYFEHECKSTYKDSDDFSGLCAQDIKIPGLDLPSDFILINKSKSNHWKMMTLWHEAGHRACCITGCPCAREGFDFRPTELHAELSALYVAVRRKMPSATLFLMQEAVRDLNNTALHYVRNAHAIIKHEVFAEGLALVQEGFDLWLDTPKNRHLRKEYQYALDDASTRACRWRPPVMLERLAEGKPFVAEKRG